MKRIKTSLISTLLLLLWGCKRETLEVQDSLAYRDSLASTFVGSPDPRQEKIFIKEILHISWSLPKGKDLCDIDYQLILSDCTVRQGKISMDKRKGSHSIILYHPEAPLLAYRIEIPELARQESSLFCKILSFNGKELSEAIKLDSD